MKSLSSIVFEWELDKKSKILQVSKTPGPILYHISYIYLSFVKFLYTVPGDGLKSVPIVTFFNDPYLFNGWADLVHFWYAYVKLDADSEFHIFKFLSLFVCLLRGVTRSVPCQALMYVSISMWHFHLLYIGPGCWLRHWQRQNV